MLVRLVLAAVIVAVALVAARVVRSRQQLDPPTQARFVPPTQLDRSDFAHPDRPWLVAVFTSDSCDACALVVDKAAVLESGEVAVDVVSYQRHRAVHDRYDIDAVPMVLIADAEGVVASSHVGPITATDLWAAVADARE